VTQVTLLYRYRFTKYFTFFFSYWWYNIY